MLASRHVNTYDVLIKMLLIGNANVGKSQILLRYSDDSFTPNFITTIGIDFKIKTREINGKRVKAQIWDTAGQEHFRTITLAYARGAHGIMFVYDTSDEQSFQGIRTWVRYMEQHLSDKTQYALIGHNMRPAGEKVVETARGEALAAELGMSFYEVSAANNTNIVEAFTGLSRQILSVLGVTAESEVIHRINYIDRCKVLLENMKTQREAVEFFDLLHPSALLDSKHMQGAVDKHERDVIKTFKSQQTEIVKALLLLPKEKKETYIAKALYDPNELLYKLCKSGMFAALSFTETSTQTLQRVLAEMHAEEAAESRRQLENHKQHSDRAIRNANSAIIFYDNQLLHRKEISIRAPLLAPHALLEELIGAEEKLADGIKKSPLKFSELHESLEDDLALLTAKINQLMRQFVKLEILTPKQLSAYQIQRKVYSDAYDPSYLQTDAVVQASIECEAKAFPPPAYNPDAEPAKGEGEDVYPDACNPSYLQTDAVVQVSIEHEVKAFFSAHYPDAERAEGEGEKEEEEEEEEEDPFEPGMPQSQPEGVARVSSGLIGEGGVKGIITQNSATLHAISKPVPKVAPKVEGEREARAVVLP